MEEGKRKGNLFSWLALGCAIAFPVLGLASLATVRAMNAVLIREAEGRVIALALGIPSTVAAVLTPLAVIIAYVKREPLRVLGLLALWVSALVLPVLYPMFMLMRHGPVIG